MRELVPLAILISVINAYYDETLDYWYSNDDGEVLDNLLPFNTKSGNKDMARSIEELHHSLFSQRNEALPGLRRQDWSMRGRITWGKGKKLKEGVSWPAGEKDCVYGEFTDIGCNKCVCLTPMIYLCSSNVCNKNRKRECVDGSKVESKDCNSCFCLGGRIMCTIMLCPIEKYNIKGITELKKSVRIRDGVHCIDGQPATIDCNKCICVGGSLLCTLIQCNSGASKLRLKAPLKANKCQPGAWYSPTGDLGCRPCYCLDEQFSFCFAGRCNMNKEDEMDHESKYYDHPKPCKPGQTSIKGTCTVCVCNKKGVWACTKNFKKCKVQFNDNNAFVLGTKSSCHGCTYKGGAWDCHAAQTQCSDYDNKEMKLGSIFLNSKGPCSACYADPLVGNICASDVTCAQKLLIKSKTTGECRTDSDCRAKCSKIHQMSRGMCRQQKCRCF